MTTYFQKYTHFLASAFLLASLAIAVPTSVDDAFTTPIEVAWPTNPTSMTTTPTGGFLVTEQRGRILTYDANFQNEQVVYNLENWLVTTVDRGLFECEFHPNFNTHSYLYCLISDRGTDDIRFGILNGFPWEITHPNVVRIELTANLQFVKAEKIFQTEGCNVGITHSVGGLKFLNDGDLVFTFGDAADVSVEDGLNDECTDLSLPADEIYPQGVYRSQRDNFVNGKLHRIEAADLILPSEQYPVDMKSTTTVMAKGLRNPFELNYDSEYDQLYIGDIGWFTKEEFNIINDATTSKPEVNFGWPCYEGAVENEMYRARDDEMNYGICDAVQNYQAPAFDYRDLYDTSPGWQALRQEQREAGVPEGELACSFGPATMTVVQRLNTAAYGTQFEDVLVMIDGTKGCAQYFTKNGDKDWDFSSGGIPLFYGFEIYILDMHVESESGVIYLVSHTQDKIYKIEPKAEGVNYGPQAQLSSSVTYGAPGLIVEFDASESYDENDVIVEYAWDFNGDGVYDAFTTEPTVEYTFADAGAYRIVVRVTDSFGLSATDDLTIIVDDTPIMVKTSSASHQYCAGDRIEFELEISDMLAALLPDVEDEAIHWSIHIQHCTPAEEGKAPDCHPHQSPLTLESPRKGFFVAADHSMPSWNVFDIEFILNNGATYTHQVEFHPMAYDIEVLSEPAGMEILFPEGACPEGKAPCTFPSMCGFRYQLGTPSDATDPVTGEALHFHYWKIQSEDGYTETTQESLYSAIARQDATITAVFSTEHEKTGTGAPADTPAPTSAGVIASPLVASFVFMGALAAL